MMPILVVQSGTAILSIKISHTVLRNRLFRQFVHPQHVFLRAQIDKTLFFLLCNNLFYVYELVSEKQAPDKKDGENFILRGRSEHQCNLNIG